MHIPDGYLSPQTYVPLSAVMLPYLALAARKVRQTVRSRNVPLLAMGAAFSFVIMMFNIPIPGGTTGHAVGDYDLKGWDRMGMGIQSLGYILSATAGIAIVVAIVMFPGKIAAKDE